MFFAVPTSSDHRSGCHEAIVRCGRWSEPVARNGWLLAARTKPPGFGAALSILTAVRPSALPLTLADDSAICAAATTGDGSRLKRGTARPRQTQLSGRPCACAAEEAALARSCRPSTQASSDSCVAWRRLASSHLATSITWGATMIVSVADTPSLLVRARRSVRRGLGRRDRAAAQGRAESDGHHAAAQAAGRPPRRLPR